VRLGKPADVLVFGCIVELSRELTLLNTVLPSTGVVD